LEDAFFAKQDAELRRRLQETESVRMMKEALRAASGITDDAVLDQLIALGLHSETVAALALIPLVEVAWADGNIDATERQAILSAAQGAGLAEHNTSYQLLENWMTNRPDPTLLSAWKHYVGALAASLSAEAKDALRQDLLERARTVAEAAGGFLGFGNKISPAEQAKLTELEQAFS
jgi:tellurite resistance protein